VPVAHACNLATQEVEIRRIVVQSQPGEIFCEILSRKTLHKNKIRLVEWLKGKALSSSSKMKKKKKSKPTYLQTL
jgi:hypothetical protein